MSEEPQAAEDVEKTHALDDEDEAEGQPKHREADIGDDFEMPRARKAMVGRMARGRTKDKERECASNLQFRMFRSTEPNRRAVQPLCPAESELARSPSHRILGGRDWSISVRGVAIVAQPGAGRVVYLHTHRLCRTRLRQSSEVVSSKKRERQCLLKKKKPSTELST